MIPKNEEIVDTLSPEEARAFMNDHGFKQVNLERKVSTPVIFIWPATLRETIHPRALWQVKPNFAIVERVMKANVGEEEAYIQYKEGESYFSLLRIPLAPPTPMYLGGIVLSNKERTRRVLKDYCFTAHPEHIHRYFPRPFKKKRV